MSERDVYVNDKRRDCVWSDHVDGNPLREAPEAVREASIRRYVPFIEQTVVGFRWEW